MTWPKIFEDGRFADRVDILLASRFQDTLHFLLEPLMTVTEILDQLKTMGSETTKKTLMRHGAREPFFGVKIGDLKKIEKKVKQDYQLSLELFDTGISDAMYLAGLIADAKKMTKKDLKKWLNDAYWYMLCEYTVAWTAAESRFGRELANEWIDSKKESTASAGWATWSSLVAITPDNDLDLDELVRLLDRVTKTITKAPNRARYTMNGFVIAVGGYVAPLNDAAMKAAKAIGPVDVDVGDSSCKVPLASEYIAYMKERGHIGKKRKTAKC